MCFHDSLGLIHASPVCSWWRLQMIWWPYCSGHAVRPSSNGSGMSGESATHHHCFITSWLASNELTTPFLRAYRLLRAQWLQCIRRINGTSLRSTPSLSIKYYAPPHTAISRSLSAEDLITSCIHQQKTTLLHAHITKQYQLTMLWYPCAYYETSPA